MTSSIVTNPDRADQRAQSTRQTDAADHREPGDRDLGAIELLQAIFADLEAKTITAGAVGDAPQGDTSKSAVTADLGSVLERLDERAFGMMLLLLALPCCLPFIYLLPQIVALPMLALAGQMALGRHSPWLPKKLSERQFEVDGFRGVLERSAKYVGWFEKLSRPRLRFLTGHTGARIVGALLMAPCASILVPLPATNTVPGIGVAIASVGLIERDGILVILGLIIGFAWIAALLIFGLEAASIMKDWISARV